MFYYLTRPLAKIGLSIYFRKIYFSNSEFIPKDKPVILAANHPTAIIEPCMLASWLENPLSFLARGDLYLTSPFFRTIYKLYRIVPVFRIIDAGYGNVKNNYETFNFCYDALEAKSTIMVLAEGKTIHEKRLRPLKKATARIAFGSFEKSGDQDIHIVPVGVNFSDSDKFRSIAMIDFGPPIRVSEYLKSYQENPHKASSDLTEELRQRLRERVIHVENPGDDELAEHLLAMHRNVTIPPCIPVSSTEGSILFDEVGLINNLNGLAEEQKAELSGAISNYTQELSSAGVTDFGLLHAAKPSLQTRVFCFFGWLPSMLGKVLNYLPLRLGDFLGNRLAPSIEFRASIAGISGSLAWLIYFILIMTMSWKCIGFYWAILALLVPALGYFHLTHSEFCNEWKQRKKGASLSEAQREELKQMRSHWMSLFTKR